MTQRSIEVLPSVSEARESKVLRIKGLLSPTEVKAVLDMDRSGCGMAARTAEGVRLLGNAPWTTWYLSTANAWKSDAAVKPVIEKVVANALKVGQTYPPMARVLASPGCGKPTVRVVELHEVTKAGGLPDPNHFDG